MQKRDALRVNSRDIPAMNPSINTLPEHERYLQDSRRKGFKNILLTDASNSIVPSLVKTCIYISMGCFRQDNRVLTAPFPQLNRGESSNKATACVAAFKAFAPLIRSAEVDRWIVSKVEEYTSHACGERFFLVILPAPPWMIRRGLSVEEDMA